MVALGGGMRVLGGVTIALAIAGCRLEKPPADAIASPTVAIVWPEDGANLVVGVPVAFLGEVTRASAKDDTVYTHTWIARSAGTVLCEAAVVPDDGIVTCEAALAVAGQQLVELEIADDQGNRILASVDVVVGENTDPTARIDAPADQAVVPAGDTVTLVAVVDDAEQDVEDLALSLTIDGADSGLTLLAESDGSVQVVLALDIGEHTLVLGVDDGAGGQAEASVSVLVADLPPTPDLIVQSFVDGAWIDATPRTGEAMRWRPVEEAPVGVTHEATWTWLGGQGGPFAAIAGDEVPAEQVWYLDAWQLEVVPSDGTLEGVPATLQLQIRNQLPTIDGCAIEPSAPATTDDLLVVPGDLFDIESEQGMQPLGASFVWQQDLGEDDWVDLAAAGSNVLLASGTERGDRFRVICVPWDGTDEGAPVESDPVVVGNTAPTLTECLLGPEEPTVSSSILAEALGFADLDGDPEQVTYDWTWTLPDGTVNTAADAGAAFPGDTPPRGTEIQVACRGVDAYGAGPEVSSSVITVVNSPPSAAGVAIDPLHPITAEALAAVITAAPTDPDGDDVTLSYTWRSGGQVYDLGDPATAIAVPSGVIARGDTWELEVVPFDGIDEGPAAVTAVLVGNAPPAIDGCSVAPASPSTSDDLTASAEGWSDPEDDLQAVKVTWQRWDGADWEDVASGATLGSAETGRDEAWRAVCVPWDGLTEGASRTSDPVQIGNAPPSLSGCTLGPASPTTVDDIVATPVGASDPDGDTVTVTYQWSVGSDLVPGATDSILDHAVTVRGEDVVAWCTPSDGVQSGSPVPSAPLEILDTLPTAPQVYISPAAPETGGSLAAALLVPAQDVDGDTLSYRWLWYRDGVGPFGGNDEQTVAAGVVRRDEEWEVRVSAFDGVGWGPEATASVVIGNRAPEVTGVQLGPQDPRADDDIVAVPKGAADAEGDAITYIWRWYVNDVYQDLPSSSTLSHDLIDRGDEVWVEVTPYDGTEYGTPVASLPVVILNSRPTAPHLEVDPFPPCDVSDLTCEVAGESFDEDGDSVTYSFVWYSTSGAGPYTTQVVSQDETSLGEGWWCQATPNDGYEDGVVGISAIRTIQDCTAPDPPDVVVVERYRNEPQMTMEGTCEPECVLLFSCADDIDSWSFDDACSSEGDFSVVIDLERGRTTSCSAVCVDASSNVSGTSNPAVTEVCADWDQRDDTPGYGDGFGDAADEWDPIDDAGTETIVITGNVLGDDVEDWFVVDTLDDVIADAAAGYDTYRFEATLTQGADDYVLRVFRSLGDMECPDQPDGYVAFSDFSDDPGNADRAAPSDPRACGEGTPDESPLRNACTDYSGAYYVVVSRAEAGAPTCEPYELTITNGVW